MLASKKSKKISKKITLSDNAPRIMANRIFREASWFVLLFIGLYMTLALGTYNPQDPSWSNAVEAGVKVSNLAGIFGAYFSDFTLYIFGLSAWWLVFLSLYSIFLIYPRIENEDYRSKHILPVHYLGFFLLIFSSSSFEAGHIVAIQANFPSEQGGMLGATSIVFLIENIGYIGSLIFLIVVFAIGFSLFTGWSWLNIAEGIGNFLCNLTNKAANYYYDWQDRKEGKKFEQQRSDFVQTERKKLAKRSPLTILDSKTEIKESVRVIKEKQTNLFGDSDAELPPIHLLDEPSAQLEKQSPETIEFISRLIEKKLLDFGIEAKVISAQPGPVITRYEFEPAPGVKGSQVTNLAKDLARALSVVSVRVVETIPGKTCMGLEIPNPNRQIVYSSEIMRLIENSGFMLHMYNNINTKAFKPMILGNNKMMGLNHLLQLDCVMVKNFEEINKLSEENLTKLILIMFYSFKSYDFVDYLISSMDKKYGTNNLEKYRLLLKNLKMTKKY